MAGNVSPRGAFASGPASGVTLARVPPGCPNHREATLAMKIRSMTYTAALAALMLAGCGSSGNSSSSTSSAAGSTSASSTSTSAPSASTFKSGFSTDRVKFRKLGLDLQKEITTAQTKTDAQLATEIGALAVRAKQQAALLSQLSPPAKYQS